MRQFLFTLIETRYISINSHLIAVNVDITKSFVMKSFNRLEDTCCSTECWYYISKTTSVQDGIKYTALNNRRFSLKFLLNLPFQQHYISNRSKKFTLPNTVYDSPVK